MEETDTEFEKDLAKRVTLVKIDTANKDMAVFKYEYMVDELPYIVVLKNGRVILKEVPNELTHDKIVDLFENFVEDIQEVPSEHLAEVTRSKFEASTPTVPIPESTHPSLAVPAGSTTA